MTITFNNMCTTKASAMFIGRAPGFQRVATDDTGHCFRADELDIYAELRRPGELSIAYTRCVDGVHTPVTGVCEQFEAYLVYSFLSRQWKFDGFSPSIPGV